MSEKDSKPMIGLTAEGFLDEVVAMREELGQVDEYGLRDDPMTAFTRGKADEVLLETELTPEGGTNE